VKSNHPETPIHRWSASGIPRRGIKPVGRLNRALSAFLAGLIGLGQPAAALILAAVWLTAAPSARAAAPVVTLATVHSFGDPLGDAAQPHGRLIEGTDGVLYGTTYAGGRGNGTVYRVNKDGTGFAVLRSFDMAVDGGYLYAGLTEGSDGMLYGTAAAGGVHGSGTVFRMNKDGSAFLVLRSVNYASDGGSLYSGVIEGSDGVLYGTAYQGGGNNAGTVYRINKDGTGFVVLFTLPGATGAASSFGGVIEGADGALYGTTVLGVTYGYGTVFRINKDGSGFVVLRSLNRFADGAYPYARLAAGGDGALYGNGRQGGANDDGTVFRMNKDGSGFAVLRSFHRTPDGSFLSGALAEGRDGALYGTALQGGAVGSGTVYRMNKDGTGFAVLRNFSGGSEGATLFAGVVEGSDGGLYGVTRDGGVNNAGTLFRVNKDGTGFSSLMRFAIATDGSSPQAGVIESRDGMLYGTAQGGGLGFGTVYRMNRDGTGAVVLRSFNGGTDGLSPQAVVEGTDGLIYGTTLQGGLYGSGTIYRMNRDGTGFVAIRSFTGGSDGGYLYGALAEGSDGMFYGTGNQGGAYGQGTVFRMNKDGTGFAVLNVFNGSSGSRPFAGVIEGTDGAIYGTTISGGAVGYGVVFRMNKNGTGYTVLRSFSAPEGIYPYGGVVEGSDGALYGANNQGGVYGAGTVYRINKDGSGFAVLRSLNQNPDGAYPQYGVREGSDGALYGTGTQGGTSGGGTVYRINKDGTGFEVLQAMGTTAGSPRNPTGKLAFGSDGRLYGTSAAGGDANLGTIFALQIVPPNQAPSLANPGNRSVNELTTLAFTLSATDGNAGDTLTYAIASGAQPGMNLGTANGAFSWTPTEAQGPGVYTVTFRVTDLAGATSSQTISIAVNEVNTAPIAVPLSLTTAEDVAVVVTLTGNDADIPANTLVSTVLASPTHGVLAANAGGFTYTPATNYNGPDSFTFVVNDGTTDSAPATVTLDVTPANDPPVAVGDAYTTDEDHAIDVASPGLLANDSDPDAGPLVRFAFAGQVISADGDFGIGDRFTGFYRVDPAAARFDIANSTLKYQYRSDHVPWEISFPGRGYRFVAASAYTWIYVGNDTPLGDRYIASLTSSSSVGTPLPSGRVLGTTQIDLWDPTSAGADLLTDDSVQTTSIGLAAALIPAGRMGFPDGSSVSLQIDQLVGPLTISEVNGQAASVGARIQLPSGALLRVNGNGSFRYDPNGSFEGLRAGATASDSFVYKVIDPEGAGATATATITVSGVNDLPRATAQAVSTAEDTGVAITLGGSDAEGDALAFAIVTPPTHGTLGGTAPRLTYTPAANYNGPDSFTYKANDGTVDSAPATVSIDVIPVNDQPVAANDSYNLGEDMILSLASAANGVLANDSDLDGDPLTAVLVSGTTHGTLALQPDGRFTYTPAANYNGPDSFTYKANDGTADSGVATVSLNVIPVNDVPVPNPQAVTTAEDTAVAITLSGSDVDGDVLGYTVASGPAHGTLGGTAPNLLYTPAADYHGPDAFVFGVDDGHGGMATATVAITVTDVLMGLSSISPASATAGGNGFTLTVEGSGFEPDTVGYWNGNARPTTYVSPTRVTVAISSGDLAGFTDIQTASVTVGEPTGPESGVAVFAIVPASVGEVQASVVPAGSTAEVASPPATATEPGVSASVANNGGAPVTVVVATYDTKPTGTTVFKVDGGSFVDVQLTGADSGDAATVKFYYPASITGGKENSVKLRYFDGVNWIAVLGSGGVAPAIDTADNLDGTVSGGRFTVVFDNTSTPKITALNGTILGMIDPAPQVLSVDGPTGPLVLGSGANVGVTYATPAPGQACQVTYDWDDGTTSTVAGNNGAAAASHAYATAGVYTVVATVRDANGATGSGKYEFVVIYDPAGGFVTGGGWILSPAGAYTGDLAATGKANFGFVSKYQKGQSIPTGNTEFQLQCAAFNFQSTAYQWLVVSGAKAQYKGNGQINGSGDYGFLLTAGDGQAAGGSGTDKFRIKIWDKASGGVVYDNRKGLPDDLDTADPQAIGGGSIVIQKSK